MSIKKTGVFASLIVLLIFASSASSLFAEDLPDAFDILDQCEAQYDYGDKDVSTTVTLIVEKPNKPKEQLQFKMFQRNRTKQFTMVQLLPEADKGAGYFWEDDNLWYYDPIGRKFSHQSTKDNIGDSDAKASDVSDTYTYRKNYKATDIHEDKLGSYKVWVITLEATTSLPDYAKSIYYIRQDIPLILKQEDYSANDRLMRTVLIPKYAKVEGNYVMTQMIIRDEVNKGEQTQQIINEFSFADLPDKVFTKAYLEQLN